MTPPTIRDKRVLAKHQHTFLPARWMSRWEWQFVDCYCFTPISARSSSVGCGTWMQKLCMSFNNLHAFIIQNYVERHFIIYRFWFIHSFLSVGHNRKILNSDLSKFLWPTVTTNDIWLPVNSHIILQKIKLENSRFHYQFISKKSMQPTLHNYKQKINIPLFLQNGWTVESDSLLTTIASLQLLSTWKVFLCRM